MPQLLSHGRIWAAIDALAARHSMTASALARAAGLDPTTFNKSKRVTATGRPRWPNTESLSRILEATGTDPEAFLSGEERCHPNRVPLTGFAQAGGGGYFDEAGLPIGSGWEESAIPQIKDEHAYALEVTDGSLEPFYREGGVIVVSPAAAIRRDDRVVVQTVAGEVMAKVLTRRTRERIELHSFNPAHDPHVLTPQDILWMARIIWASQ